MMIRPLVSVIVVFIGTAACGQPEDQLRHVRVVEVDSEDRGLVPPGSPVQRRVHLVNKTHSLLKVRLVKKTCGCVDFALEHDRVAPGELTEVSVGTMAVQEIGPQRHGAELEIAKLNPDETTSDPERVTVFYEYTPDLDYTVVPDRILLDVVQGSEISTTVFVQRFAADRLKVRAATCSIAGLRFGESRVSDVHPDVLRVPLSGIIPEAGLSVGRIELEVESPKNPRAVVPIAIRTIPPIVVEPAAVVCRQSDLKREYSFRVCARPGHESVMDGLSVSNPLPGVTASLGSLDQDGSRQVKIQLDKSSLGQTGAVSIHIRSSKTEAMSVPIRIVWFK